MKLLVVSYRNSTSNHNTGTSTFGCLGVVSYRNSTSNHNLYPVRIDFIKLYLIEILHQTTTIASTTSSDRRCILSKFYIKPQHCKVCKVCKVVVSYRNSTSNHNSGGSNVLSALVVSYRNSTSNHNNPHNIQRRPEVVSYRNSTSNHNWSC